MKWEATAFGRPMLALMLVASLALFPVFFIPSGPSMWLAGMIFGYGLGFVIIMVGTTIGMVLPYLIGLLFRDRIHVRLLSVFFFFSNYPGGQLEPYFVIFQLEPCFISIIFHLVS